MDSLGFTKWFFLLSFVLLLLVGWFVYLMDPYWSFSHSHRFNSLQFASNERVQKSNMVFFGKFNYDTLILGSSRVTFINQNDFKGMRAFNYSFSMALPYEYESYIDFAKQKRGKEFKNIIIGMDFFGSNQNIKKNFNADEIFSDINGLVYRYRILFTIDALKNSLENLKRSIFHKVGGRSYDRHNIAYTTKMNKDEVKKYIIKGSLRTHKLDGFLKSQDKRNLLIQLLNSEIRNLALKKGLRYDWRDKNGL